MIFFPIYVQDFLKKIATLNSGSLLFFIEKKNRIPCENLQIWLDTFIEDFFVTLSKILGEISRVVLNEKLLVEIFEKL